MLEAQSSMYVYTLILLNVTNYGHLHVHDLFIPLINSDVHFIY